MACSDYRAKAICLGWLVACLVGEQIAFASLGISSSPDETNWGVGGGLVHAITSSGGVVYIGGSFTQLISEDGLTVLPASRLAAFDAKTGMPTSWRPTADGTVFALAAGGDGIYVGGAFNTIDGIPRSHFAAISREGNLLWSADANSTIRCFALSGNTLYMGGAFRQIRGQRRLRLAAIQTPATGETDAVLLPWAPSITSTNGPHEVTGLTVSATSVVAIGTWTHVNGQPEPDQARFDPVTGKVKYWSNNVELPAKGVTTDGTNFFGAFAGQKGGRLVAWGPSGSILWQAWGNGDMQAVTFFAGHVIVGGHFTKIRSSDLVRLAAFTPDGRVLSEWLPKPDSGGDRGVWALHGADKLYVGGGFGRIGMQPARGYAQLSDIEAPLPPSNLSAIATSWTQVDLGWTAATDNIGVIGYQVFRDGSFLTSVGAITNWSDTTISASTTYQYQVYARDAGDNLSEASDTATVT